MCIRDRAGTVSTGRLGIHPLAGRYLFRTSERRGGAPTLRVGPFAVARALGKCPPPRIQFRIPPLSRGSRRSSTASRKWRDWPNRAFLYATTLVARWNFATSRWSKVLRRQTILRAAGTYILSVAQHAARRGPRLF